MKVWYNMVERKNKYLKTLSNKEYTRLVEVLEKQNKNIEEIKHNINSNPFIDMFNTKGNARIKNILKFIITAIFMIVLFLLSYNVLYMDKSFLDKTFDILGNGFFWILAVITYWFISKYIESERGQRLCNKIELMKRKK